MSGLSFEAPISYLTKIWGNYSEVIYLRGFRDFALKSDTKDFLELYVPWTAFKCSWRGEKVDWCPDITTQLDKFNMIGISTAFPGKAGKFNLEVESISARKF